MKNIPLTAFAAAIVPSVLLAAFVEPRQPANVKAGEPSTIRLSPAQPPTHRVSAVPTPDAALSAVAADDSALDASTAIDEDLRCLALNIYHEARSEPRSGQIAVARVTMNRVESSSFPSSVCDVVRQGGEQRNRCQFSWWCDGKSDEPTEERAWRRSLEIGKRVLADKVSDPTDGALFYHADYVQPKWSRSFNRTAQIGRHLFYRPSRES
jgi:spore germination cell wall hydrolase CwlJ-like protein